MRITGIVRPAIDEQKESDLFFSGAQLAGHFVGNISAKAIPAQIIRASRLEFEQVRGVLGRNLFDPGELFKSVHAPRLKGVNRLLWPQVPRQVAVSPEHPSADSMHQEQWRVASARLNFDD